MAHTIRDKQKLLNRVRRIRGQIEGVERALEKELDCEVVLHTIAAARGAINSLMAEVLEGQIRDHVHHDPERSGASPKAKAAQSLIDVVRAYLK